MCVVQVYMYIIGGCLFLVSTCYYNILVICCRTDCGE